MSILNRWAKRIGENAADEALKDAQPEIDKAMKDALEPLIKSAVEKVFKTALDDLYENSPRFRFVKWMQAELERVGKDMTHQQSFKMARDTLFEFLKDEKIEFGDSNFAWDRSAAIELIQAYEIDHWCS